jgi:hypothetical protein
LTESLARSFELIGKFTLVVTVESPKTVNESRKLICVFLVGPQLAFIVLVNY